MDPTIAPCYWPRQLLQTALRLLAGLFFRYTRRPLLLLPVLLMLGVCQQSQAFCPRNGLLCFITAKSSGSLTHEDITQRAISDLDKSYFSVPKLTTSMQKALDEIIEANAEVDQDQVSSAKHFDGENGAGAQLRLKTLKQNVLDALNASPINTSGARDNLGGALHTIQDFYSHSNWVEMGNAGANPDVGRSVQLPFADPAVTACSGFLDTGLTCANSSTIVTSLLTSGYYGGEDRAKPGLFKCSHGGPLDKSSPSSDPVGYFREGINKDTLYCDLSPHSTFHHAAAGAAIAATKQFVDDIKALINDEQLKALLGAGPTLAFAIDTTGSMDYIIAGVRASAIDIVNSRLGTDEEPLQYVLAPFNDPFTGPTTSTNDAALFKSRISGLLANGGGDCPELSMTGIYNGLSLSNPGGNLFMYTDASSKDASLFGAVLGLAKAKSIRLYMILFGSCSPLDPVYLQAANETGGQVFFLSGDEAGQVTQLADLAARNNAVQVLSVVDTYATAKTYSLPVDASMSRLTVSVSGTAQDVLPAVSLIRPDGVRVTPADAATYLNLSSGVIISIERPAIGAWTLKVDGSPEQTYVNVSGIADLAFISFKLARFGGQPPHQGLFPIDGEPGPGDAVYGLAALTGGPASSTFHLRRKNYTAISDLALAQDATDTNKFFGPLTVPGETFLAYVTGKDTAGNDYQRVMSLALAPQNISVTAPSAQDLRPGKITTLLYQVKNNGAAGAFRISAIDDLHYIVSVTPASLTLGTGESASVIVTLTPPPDAPIGSADTITVAMQSTLNPLLRNSASLTSFVTGALETPGRPDFVADMIGQETISPGVIGIDVRFTNAGIGTARDMTLSSLRLRTLSGSGTVSLNAALTPALPLVMPNVDVGSFFTVRLTFNVPAGVQRFSVTESGTVLGIDGASYALSQGQAVIVGTP